MKQPVEPRLACRHIAAMTNEILTPAEMYHADAFAVANGIPSLKLMEHAGKAVAGEVLRRFKRGRIAVLCGPGNNGGDGFVAARLLKAKGRVVDVYALMPLSSLKGDAMLMARKWKGRLNPITAFNPTSKAKPAVIVDALFGAGLSRDFPQALADQVNGCGTPVLAVDVPSGLDGLTGKPRGACIKADLTVTFFRKKPAHVLEPGRSLCGEIVVADIGIPDTAVAVSALPLFENATPQIPQPGVSAHKFTRGHAVVWSGPEFNTGAARLAAIAAARSGAGLTTLCGTVSALRVQAAHVTSIMLRPVETVQDLGALLQDKRITAFCTGPAAGIAQDTRNRVLRVLRSDVATVLDADALTAFADAPDELFSAIRGRAARGQRAPVVLTPHEGEFSRLFHALPQTAANKVERARAAAAASGAVVLLKGPDTVVAEPGGMAVVNTNGTPKLATAGSGDVLAGIITGLMAQGMPAFDAARGAAWLHADAARRCPRQRLIAEDLLAELGT